MLGRDRVREIRESVDDKGVDWTAKKYGLKRETVRRYCREGGGVTKESSNDDVVTTNATLAAIAECYSEKELKLLASGGLPMEYKHTPVHNFHGDVVRIGYLSDTHIGSVYTDYDYIDAAHDEFYEAGVDMVVIAGDITEGVSNRAGHVYECTEYGYDAQKEKAVELFADFDFCPLYMIDGNHDRWYIKNSGAKIVKDICDELPYAEFLGHDEGDIVLSDSVRIKLWHGEDGSSYAHSYRLQKLIESLQGGEKPSVLFAGHVHKYGHFFERNIHCISAGSIQKQSKWMRGKRLPAHTGFGVVEMEINDDGVGRFSNTFFPFYA